jgi:hypothetical protein
MIQQEMKRLVQGGVTRQLGPEPNEHPERHRESVISE